MLLPLHYAAAVAVAVVVVATAIAIVAALVPAVRCH